MGADPAPEKRARPPVARPQPVDPSCIQCRCDDARRRWHAPEGRPQGYHVTGIGDEFVSYEGGAAAPPFGSAALPFHGAELTRWMNNWDCVEQFALIVRDTGVGSVHQGPGGRTLIRYSGQPAAAVSLAMPRARFDRDMLSTGVGALSRTMARIENALARAD